MEEEQIVIETPAEEVVTTTETPAEETVIETAPAEEVTTAAEEPVDDNLIELADGTKVTAQELVNGYLRQSDYTKKTQALAEERKRVNATAAIVNGSKPVETKVESTKIVSKYKPEQLDELKGIMNELGYVSKHELAQQTEQQKRDEVVRQFFVQHPEYKAENDIGDVKYSELREELSMYNTQDPNILPKALQKAHESIVLKHAGDKNKDKLILDKTRQIVAKNPSTTGSSGTGSPSANAKEKTLTKAQIDVLKDMGLYDNEEPID